jgi:hypothetical protein
MLELFVFATLWNKLSSLATSRGRSSGWGLLGIAGWIGGEMFGYVLGAAADLGAGAYLIALLGAMAGAFVVYRILLALPSLASPDLDIEKITDTFR